MMARKREMVLIGFMQAQNCSNYIGSWRHAESVTDFLGPQYYQRIAQTLEQGKFQLCFFDDRLAMPDILGNDHAEAVRNGARVVKMDPVSILACMGMATKNIGLGSTYSTTYYQPFHVARVMSTLDLMVGGRAAWNVVTSLNDSEAHNMGQGAHAEHDLRYDMADEFMEVVLGHWDTWEDDALVVDKSTGFFAHPEKVHRLDHKGKWYTSKGPFTVPRSAQGRPVVIQAGQSGRGQQFSARWGELVFWVLPNIEMGKRTYDNFKSLVAKEGRDPDSVAVAPAIYVVPGETKAMAEDKMAIIESTAKPIDGLALLSEALNFDFYSKGMDESFSDEEMAGIGGLRAVIDRVTALSGKKNPTIRDFVQFSSRGTVREFPRFVGTPKEIADGLEEWFNTCCDGFVVAATHIPGAYEDFVRLVVPELQRRGLHQKDYKGPTLRENLGLPKAGIGDWKPKA